jgi:hypothetical protein
MAAVLITLIFDHENVTSFGFSIPPCVRDDLAPIFDRSEPNPVTTAQQINEISQVLQHYVLSMYHDGRAAPATDA